MCVYVSGHSVGISNNIGTFLQLSDIHHDPEYAIGSPTNCFLGSTGMGCCRADSIPLDPPGSANKWGDFNCDMSDTFLDAALKWINNTFNNNPENSLDFAIVTGDLLHHKDLDYSIKSNTKNIKIFTDFMNKYFPYTFIIPIRGNHDSCPIDQQWKANETLSENIAKLWKPWFDDFDDDNTAYNTFKSYGYYTLQIVEGVYVIAIDTLWNDKNNIITHYETDPGNQYAWLEKTLSDYERRDADVWVLMHIPLGSGEMSNNASLKLQSMFARYNDTIKYIFAGHTHNDHFKFIRDDNNTIAGYLMIDASMESDHRNPSFRRYFYDRETFKILDYEQYVLNFTNQLENDEFVGFDLSYVFTKQYNVPDVSLSSYLSLDEKLAINESMFSAYYHNYTPLETYPICEDECRKNLLCEINYVNQYEYNNCLVNL